jgi:NADP-dependent 3-hydroxy acid dehydrogenase YdfG
MSTTNRPCILITGAGKGIGQATARLFAQHGWWVGAADNDHAALDALVQELGPERAIALPLDVTQPAQWQAALQSFDSTCGRLDVLLNNAGLLTSGPLTSVPLDRHHALVDVNVKGLLNGCYLAKPYLQKTAGARLINLSSTSAVYGQADLATYAATKFAVRGLTEGLNIEWQNDGIRVMDIMPLYVRTGMLQDIQARSAARLGIELSPQDVAATIWKAAHFQGSYGKVHWPLNWKAVWMFRLTSLSPNWLARAIARHIAV